MDKALTKEEQYTELVAVHRLLAAQKIEAGQSETFLRMLNSIAVVAESIKISWMAENREAHSCPVIDLPKKEPAEEARH